MIKWHLLFPLVLNEPLLLLGSRIGRELGITTQPPLLLANALTAATTNLLLLLPLLLLLLLNLLLLVNVLLLGRGYLTRGGYLSRGGPRRGHP
jgi:hypothetical protein